MFLPLIRSADASVSIDIGDNVAYSLMLDGASSQYISKAFGSGTSTKFCMSFWHKRCDVSGNSRPLFYTDASNYLRFNTNDALQLIIGGATVFTTTAVYRDPAAWMSIVLSYDNAASPKWNCYVNGSSVATGTTTNSNWNTNITHYIANTVTNYANGYFAKFIWLDNQSLDYTSFGRTSSDTGAFVHKEYAGTHAATNDCYLEFANSASLGADSWGGTAWTTSGGITSANQYTDTPTNNYQVFNKLSTVTTATLSVGNTKTNASTVAIGSIGMSSGKWYWEISSATATTTCGMYNTAATSTTTVTAGVTKGFRFDADAGTFDWTTDGSSWTSITTGLTSGPYFIYVSTAATALATLNSGSKTWTVGGTTPPTGYSALCTANLTAPTIPKPSLHFDAALHTGNGTAIGSGGKSVSGIGFQPGLVWIKGRSGATDHAIYDAVRGTTKDIGSNLATDETTQSEGVTTFGSGGFTVGSLAKVNTNTATYVDYMWKANGAGSSGSGSGLTSITTSANATAGFSITKYTGHGVAGEYFNHGLAAAPKLVLIHATTTAGADQGWFVWHTALANTEYLLLNSTAVKATGSTTTLNSTTPDGTKVTLGTSALVNTSGDTYIAYCFAEIEGFSKFGSYTGNASADGTFVYCGFRPRWVLIKQATTTTRDWFLYNTSVDTYNYAYHWVKPNATDAENTTSTANTWEIDVLSNGFKIRNNGGFDNASGETFIFAAFAELPLKYATAR